MTTTFASLWLAIFMFTGCGTTHASSDEAVKTNSLDGTQWTYEEGDCAQFLFFEKDKYTSAYGCLNQNVVQLEVTNGIFQSEETLELTPNESSCPSPPALSFQYSMTTTNLTITAGSRTYIFQSYKEEGDGEQDNTTIVYGCFSSDGTFEEHAVTAI